MVLQAEGRDRKCGLGWPVLPHAEAGPRLHCPGCPLVCEGMNESWCPVHHEYFLQVRLCAECYVPDSPEVGANKISSQREHRDLWRLLGCPPNTLQWWGRNLTPGSVTPESTLVWWNGRYGTHLSTAEALALLDAASLFLFPAGF